MTSPAKINFKIYQGTTWEQSLRWESETKTYATITNITKSAPVVITIGDVAKLPPIGWRVRVTNVLGMKELNMPEGHYEIASDIEGEAVVLNQVNSAGYSNYTGGGILEYNTPVSLGGYVARMQVRKKLKDSEVVLSLTTENGGITIDNLLKVIYIKATPAQTSVLNFSQAVYDLELISPTGDIIRFAEGSLTLRAEVTR